MHGLFLHLFAYGFVSMSIWGVRKWPKKCEEMQKYKLHKSLNPLGRKAFRGASFSATKHKRGSVELFFYKNEFALVYRLGDA